MRIAGSTKQERETSSISAVWTCRGSAPARTALANTSSQASSMTALFLSLDADYLKRHQGAGGLDCHGERCSGVIPAPRDRHRAAEGAVVLRSTLHDAELRRRVSSCQSLTEIAPPWCTRQGRVYSDEIAVPGVERRDPAVASRPEDAARFAIRGIDAAKAATTAPSSAVTIGAWIIRPCGGTSEAVP